ncbi:hypothetical protein L226DRAFT_476665 [Lentinus tigrinus ALCF2SS1-7]|uniref:Uncharacterized protein n=1 Tax=Lentinus tigrinus ALCF2SS1-6 TaxID=1328759 RepID=A0A5C2T3C3_9APHY|nr:hypothetical protein L227DRAFT_515638 [Lentinus tigrinus ALCF2SS1-6]RPD80729.1 hypothetical protein L226DRAFT_476665 [Lentinus tigrinus ALCF2SS1-7]
MDPTTTAPEKRTVDVTVNTTDAPPQATAAAPERSEEWSQSVKETNPWITFPPFPAVPPGVELIPFKDFKPLGIQIVDEPEPGHVEVDGLGIPTVTLRVHHDLTEMEKRKRKNKKKVAADGTVIRQAWYDEWEDNESSRRLSAPIDSSLPRVERLHIATHEFKSGRPLHQNQDLTNLWNHFRVFLGLIASVQPPAARKKIAAINQAMAAQQEAYDDDVDGEDEMPNASAPKERTVLIGDQNESRNASNPLPSSTAEESQKRSEYYREVRNEKSDRFLNDAEKCIKIFLSGYYRDRGMAFSEKSCRDGPILLDFFLKFLLRHRIFPEMEKSLKKAIAVAELAKKELPHTFVLSKTVPDGFSEGCKLLYGSMAQAFVWSHEEEAGDSSDTLEPEAKRQKMEEEMKGVAAEAAVLQAAAGAEQIEVVTEDLMHDMEQEMKDLTAEGVIADKDPSANPDAEAAPVWGEPVPDFNWGAPETAATWDTLPTESPFFKYLGPTALPLTHTTGVIESSTRRIKSVTMPPPSNTQQKKKKKGGKDGEPAPLHDPEAVERELEGTFAKMTLVPWPEWDTYDKSDVVKPRLLRDSRGAAVTDDCEGAEVTPGPGPVHNPFKDEITVYIEPSTVDKIIVGMGIDATWVQLARVDPNVPIELDPRLFNNLWPYGIEKEPGGPGVPVAPTKIWYMEQVRAVHPSFHKEMIPLPTTQDIFGEDA